MNVRYRVALSQVERSELTAMLSKGKRAARKLKRAQILLAADAGRGDEEIARTVAVSGSTVYRTKRRFVEGNLERALSEEPRPGAERKLTGKEEALLVATACASPPEGRARWTLELLAGAMVKLTDHESLSGETVRRRLAENGLKPWRKDMWCIPKVDGEYVASGGRLKITPTACANSSMSIIPPPRASASCRITCRPTRPARSTRPLRLPRPGESCAASSSTTPQSTPVGSTWLRSRSACSVASAWTAESTTRTGSAAKSTPGNNNETPPEPVSIGCSQPTKPAPKWAAPIPSHPKSQNHCDEVLATLRAGKTRRNTPPPIAL